MAYLYLYLLVEVLLFFNILTKSNLCIYLVFIILIFFSGLRDGVGADYYSYVEIFKTIVEQNDFWNIEIGYIKLVKIISSFGLNAQFLFLLMAIFTNFFILKAILKMSNSKWLSVQLYFLLGINYLSSLNEVRQSLTIAMFLYSYNFIENNKLLKYVIVIILGSFFHKSILILLPFYFLVKLNCIEKIYKSLYVLSILSLFSFRQVIKLFGYEYYIDRASEANLDWKIVVFLILNQIVISFRSKIKLNKIEINTLIFSNILMILIIVNQFLFPNLTWILLRVVKYFLILNLIIIPNIVCKFSLKLRVVINIIIFIFLSFLYSKSLNNLGEYNYNLYLKAEVVK